MAICQRKVPGAGVVSVSWLLCLIRVHYAKRFHEKILTWLQRTCLKGSVVKDFHFHSLLCHIFLSLQMYCYTRFLLLLA